MKAIVAAALLLGVLLLMQNSPTQQQMTAQNQDDDNLRIRKGLAIAPVPLDLKGKNIALVGWGSYIVNAQGACNDCHTCPSYAPGHNPFQGQGPGQYNAANYLAGGVPFGPSLVSANLTPVNGLPEGHTFEQFASMLKTGRDTENPNQILQVMPWPVYRHMLTRDLRAIYEYLSAIPPAQPGTCTGAGE